MIVYYTFLAAAGSTAVAVLFNTKLRRLPFVGLLGGVAYLANHIIFSFTNGQILSLFCASVILGLLSEFLAIALKSPSIVFSLVGLIPILPGFAAYTAVKLILEKNLIEGALKSIYAISAMASIICGILLATSLVRLSKQFKEKCRGALRNRMGRDPATPQSPLPYSARKARNTRKDEVG